MQGPGLFQFPVWLLRSELKPKSQGRVCWTVYTIDLIILF